VNPHDLPPGPSARVTIVCPLEFERRALARAGLATLCDLHRSGPGRAAITAWAAAIDPPPGPVVLAGLAGGLQPPPAADSDATAAGPAATSRARIVTRVRDEAGKVCVLSAVASAGPVLPTGSPRPASGKVCVLSALLLSALEPPDCTVVSRGRIVVSAREKRALGEETGADLVDLESAAFAETATARGWSWGIVRGVSDDVGTDLPAGVGSWTDDRGRTRPLRVLADVLRRPASIASLLRLRRDGERALREVADLLRTWLES